MLGTAFVALLLVAAIGLGVKFLLPIAVEKDLVRRESQITWLEYGVAIALVGAIIVPSVLSIGKGLSVDQILRHEEPYNGVEVAAPVHPEECYAGHAGESYSAGQSNCQYTYVSGRYSWEEEYYETVCKSDGKGGQSCTSERRCCHTNSANIYSPYAKTEFKFSVRNSLRKTYTYPTTYIAQNAIPYGREAIPAHIPRGVPEDWIEAKRQIDIGDPRSVTALFWYDNPILVREDEKIAEFSEDIGYYLERKLLPDHTANILTNPIFGEPRTRANKLSFVGVNVPDQDVWQESLMRFNAPLGEKLEGNLHVVVIDSKLVKDPQGYRKALRAHWLSKYFGKRALAKNGIILVIGTSNGKIDWAQADTGMPFGNNIMLRAMENNLTGKELNPDIIFGRPRTVVIPATREEEKDKVIVTLSTPLSVLEEAMFVTSPFKRSCMLCEGEEDEGVGYGDYIAQIEPDTDQKAWMIVIICILSLPFWWGVAVSTIVDSGWATIQRKIREKDYS